MKKATFILIISILVFGCKKNTTPPANQVGVNMFKSGTIEIWINSNYTFPYGWFNKNTKVPSTKPGVQYTNVITNYKEWNPSSPFADSTEIYFKKALGAGDYQIYSTCSKNSIDSTKYMKDQKQIYNYMKVSINGKTVFENHAPADGPTKKSSSNSFSFTLYQLP